jgi:hypothetical protein
MVDDPAVSSLQVRELPLSPAFFILALTIAYWWLTVDDAWSIGCLVRFALAASYWGSNVRCSQEGVRRQQEAILPFFLHLG